MTVRPSSVAFHEQVFGSAGTNMATQVPSLRNSIVEPSLLSAHLPMTGFFVPHPANTKLRRIAAADAELLAQKCAVRPTVRPQIEQYADTVQTLEFARIASCDGLEGRMNLPSSANEWLNEEIEEVLSRLGRVDKGILRQALA